MISNSDSRWVDNLIKLFFIVYDHWKKEKDFNRLFNEFNGPLACLEYVHTELVKLKLIMPLKQLSDPEKIRLKKKAFEIDRNCSIEKGVKMCKAIYILETLPEL